MVGNRDEGLFDVMVWLSDVWDPLLWVARWKYRAR